MIRSTRSRTVSCASYEKLNASPRSSGLLRQLLGQQQVGGRAVLDVEIVADVLSIRADDRALAPEDRADRARDEATPVQVAAAVEIAAARDAHGQVERGGVALGDQVGAGLADVVREARPERRRPRRRRPMRGRRTPCPSRRRRSV